MDASLDDLYREIILDHNRNPRNYGVLDEGHIIEIEEFNPLCGDKIVLYLQSDKEIIVNVQFTGEGCSISQASASKNFAIATADKSDPPLPNVVILFSKEIPWKPAITGIPLVKRKSKTSLVFISIIWDAV